MGTKKTLLAMATTALLTACGGGSDSAPSTPPEPVPPPVETSKTAEGFWEGRTSDGMQAAAVVLENGETWGITADGYQIGAFYGQIQSNDSKISGSGFEAIGGKVYSGSINGTFNSRKNISITSSAGGYFYADYVDDYDYPANLQDIAGSYYGLGVTLQTYPELTSISIDKSGVIKGSSSYCSISGSASPRASGKNVFDLKITLSGSNCPVSGVSTKGIAYYDRQEKSVLAMGLNSNQTDGFIYIGDK